MRHQASAFSSLTVPATRAHAPVRWCRRRTPHGTIIAQTTVTNLFDAGRSIECGMFADTGAGALPMDWKSRLGEFQRCEVVELQLGNGEAVRGQACWPVKLRSRVLARISHQAASRRQKSSWFQEVDRDANDRAGCRLRWPCPRGSFGPVRAHAPSTVGPAMLSVASTRTGPKSSAIITAPGEKCGLGLFRMKWCCSSRSPAPRRSKGLSWGVVLEQAQAAVDPVGHRLDPVRHLDLK